MRELNSAVLILKNQNYLNKFLNYFKKYNLDNIFILSSKKKITFKNKKIIFIKLKKNEFDICNISKIIKKKINKDFFLFRSDYFINLNLFSLEKYFYRTKKNLYFYENKTTNYKIPPFSIINKNSHLNLDSKYNFIKYKKLKNHINLSNSSKLKIKNFFKKINKNTIFLDRDGVLNKDIGYVSQIRDFAWMPGAKRAIKYLVKKNYNIFIITNQSGIARGYFTRDDVEKLHNFILHELKKKNCYINEIFYSPFHRDGIIKKFKKISNCRKPRTKFYKMIRNNWDIKHKNIYMIGDKEIDLKFAKNCGIKGALFKEKNLYNFIRKFI